MLQMLDLGTPVDLLTHGELRDALAEDARLRSTLAGVKPVEVYLNQSQIGAGGAVFSTSGQPPYAPLNGYMWAVMSLGVEQTPAAVLNIYKGTPSAVVQGSKVVARGGSQNVQAFNFSKGQLWLRPGDQLTFIPGSGAIISVFMTVIECPAERVAELLI